MLILVNVQSRPEKNGSNRSPIRKRSRINSDSQSASEIKSTGKLVDSLESSRKNSPVTHAEHSNSRKSPPRGRSRSPKRNRSRSNSRDNSVNKAIVSPRKRRPSSKVESPKKSSRSTNNGTFSASFLVNSEEKQNFHELALSFLKKAGGGKEKILNYKNTIYTIAALFCRWSHLYTVPQKKGQFAKYLSDTSSLRRQAFPSIEAHKLHKFKLLSYFCITLGTTAKPI